MAVDERAPVMLGSHADPDARSPRNRSDHDSAIFDEQPAAEKIQAVLRERDPHRHGQISRTSTEVVNAGPGPAPAAHHWNAVGRIERANQNRRRRTLRFGDDVDEAVDPVVEVDVCVAGLGIERLVAPRRPRRGMTRRIGLADVGFDFDDDAARLHAATIVDENFSQEIARHVERGAIVKGAREFSRP
jgi:hypothetical protein